MDKMKVEFKWADGGLVNTTLQKKKLEVCGPPPAKGEGK